MQKLLTLDSKLSSIGHDIRRKSETPREGRSPGCVQGHTSSEEGSGDGKRWRAPLRAALAAAGACASTALLGAAPASADAGKVLVFTGTAGTANPVHRRRGHRDPGARHGEQLHGRRHQRRDEHQRGEPRGLPRGHVRELGGRRAQPAAGSRAPGATSRTAAASSASARPPSSSRATRFFDTLIGLTGAARTTRRRGQRAGRRVPRPRPPGHGGAPLLRKAHSDDYYAWTANPTGQVHTVARVRFNALPDGTSVTNDAVTRFTGTTNTIQPQLERALSWCRDVQQGRSFYTGLGGTAAAYGDGAVKKQLLGAIQWASGMARGNCKATINTNYTATRLTPQNPAAEPGPARRHAGPNALRARSTAWRSPRTVACSTPAARSASRTCPRSPTGTCRTSAWAAARSTSGIPNVAGADDQNAAKVAKVGEMQVFGAKGGGSETGPTSKDEQGILGIALDPDFTNGRPYIYVAVPPVLQGRAGRHDRPDQAARPGLRPRRLHGRAPPVALHVRQRDQDARARLGEGHLALDDAGLLLLPPRRLDGLRLQGQPVLRHRRQHRQHAELDQRRLHQLRPDLHGPGRRRRARQPQHDVRRRHISFADARQTSGNTNAYEGKLLRIKPMAEPGTSGHRDDVHDPGCRRPERRRNCSRPTARPSRTARPSPRCSRWASATCTRSTSTPRPTRSRPRGSGPTRAPTARRRARRRPRTRRDQRGRQLRLAVLPGR